MENPVGNGRTASIVGFKALFGVLLGCVGLTGCSG